MNMQLNEKAAFIKGVIEGLELDPKDKQTKVLKLMSELLVEMAQEIKELDGDSGDCGEMAYEVTCPTCGNVEYLDEDSLNEGSITCSKCGELLEFDYNEDELDDSSTDEEA